MKSVKWISVCNSIIGSSHINEGLPCQDSSIVKYIENTDFIIAAISDGAGSCVNSHLGSGFLVENVIDKIITSFDLQNYQDNKITEINKEIWREKSFEIFKTLKIDLEKFGIENNIEFKTLSSTLIVAISDGNFIACANIGDGRAAYRNTTDEWCSMMVPTKGEEANQTLFITSDLWEDNQNSEYFGTFFYDSPITAFGILSDGCERASFEVLKYNEEQEKYFDPNMPYKPFFEPNYLNLLKIKNSNIDQNHLNDLWGKFLDNGSKVLINETDDKSMVLAVYLISDENHESES